MPELCPEPDLDLAYNWMKRNDLMDPHELVPSISSFERCGSQVDRHLFAYQSYIFLDMQHCCLASAAGRSLCLHFDIIFGMGLMVNCACHSR